MLLEGKDFKIITSQQSAAVFLAVLDVRTGGATFLTPEQARTLATALIEAADAADESKSPQNLARSLLRLEDLYDNKRPLSHADFERLINRPLTTEERAAIAAARGTQHG